MKDVSKMSERELRAEVRMWRAGATEAAEFLPTNALVLVMEVYQKELDKRNLRDDEN